MRVHVVESEYECEAYDAGFAVLMEDADACRVHVLEGEGRIDTIKPDPNTNLIRTKTLIPMAVTISGRERMCLRRSFTMRRSFEFNPIP